MAYFNHAFKKVFLATKSDATVAESGGFDPAGVSGENAGVQAGILTSTGVHVSNLKSTAAAEGFQLGRGVTGFFDSKTDLSLDLSSNTDCCKFYVASTSIKLNDKQGPFHGGYQESTKSKVINPKYLRKAWKVDGSAASQAVLGIGDYADADGCEKEFLCGETYYLRVEAKGTAALRFANHNLYQTLQADGGCCTNPSAPDPVDPSVIYLQWATAIAENPYLKDFINPILVIDGDSFAYSEELAAAAGLAAGKVFSAAPTTTVTNAGLVLLGAYVDTKFEDCTFQPMDYYGVEPIQLFASEVDYNGDPCTFGGVCVVEECPGIMVQGTGESKVRELLLSEAYLTNFMHSDLRIREITQGTEVYNVLDRLALYSSFFMLHSVPRYNNPSGTFDNDQYLLEIIGSDNTTAYLETEVNGLIDNCGIACEDVEDYSMTTTCSYTLPTA